MTKSKPDPIRILLFLGLLVIGFAFSRMLRFTKPLFNEILWFGSLFLPFLAIRPLLELPKIPKRLGLILLSPILLLSLLMMAMSVACDKLDWVNENPPCTHQLGEIRQAGYSVNLIFEDCGGAIDSTYVLVEQRKTLFPGLYLYRTVEIFDSAYEGTITPAGPDQIRVHIPEGAAGSFWNKEVDRVYKLKRHVFF
jgi:hypothetical protein